MPIVILDREVSSSGSLCDVVKQVLGDTCRLYCLQSESDCEVIIREQNITIAILGDVVVGHLNRENVVKRWLSLKPDLLIVVYSGQHHVTCIENLSLLGARAFVDKMDDLLCVFQKALTLQGGDYCSPEVCRMFYTRKRDAVALDVPNSYVDALHCLANGLDNKQITLTLGMRPRTITRAREVLRKKLSVDTNEQLMCEAKRQGLI